MKGFVGALVMVAQLACAVGCTDRGKLFVWNGTGHALLVGLSGGIEEELAMAPGGGRLFERAAAGTYSMVTRHPDGKQTTSSFEVAPGKLAIVNVDSAACFARVDISGMYTPNKERVILLESYHERPVLTLEDIIHVFPGEPVPEKRPKSAYAFQRLYQVPCGVVNNRLLLTDYLRKQK